MSASAKEQEKLLVELVSQNTSMSDSLLTARAAMEMKSRALETYPADKKALNETLAQQLVLESHLEQLVWRKGVLLQRFKQAASARDELYLQLHQVLALLQSRVQGRYEDVQAALDAAEISVTEGSPAVNGEPMSNDDPVVSLRPLAQALGDLMLRGEGAIEQLQSELDTVLHAHRTLVEEFEDKARAMAETLKV